MSLEIIAELLKYAPLLLKRYLPLWQLLFPESAFGSFFLSFFPNFGDHNWHHAEA